MDENFAVSNRSLQDLRQELNQMRGQVDQLRGQVDRQGIDLGNRIIQEGAAARAVAGRLAERGFRVVSCPLRVIDFYARLTSILLGQDYNLRNFSQDAANPGAIKPVFNAAGDPLPLVSVKAATLRISLYSSWVLTNHAGS